MIEETFHGCFTRWVVVCKSRGWSAEFKSGLQTRPNSWFPKYQMAADYAKAGANCELLIPDGGTEEK